MVVYYNIDLKCCGKTKRNYWCNLHI